MREFLRRLNIGPRLALSFMLIILMALLGIGVGLWQINVIRTEAEQLFLVEQQESQSTQAQIEAIETIRRVQRGAVVMLVIIGALTIIYAAGLSYAVTRSIAIAVSRLTLRARAMAQGDFSRPIKIEGHDELSDLTSVFNDTAAQLAELYAGLEEQVNRRTQELHHRAVQLETSIALSRQITSILDQEVLLTRAVDLIKARYGYTYVAIFLVSPDGSHLHLKTSTETIEYTAQNDAGQLAVGPSNIIGWVAAERRPAAVGDVTDENRFGDIQAKPGTQSKLVLPLAMGHELLGVLEIESDVSDAFNQEDAPVLQALADQLAIAIQNAALFQKETSRRRLVETLHRVSQALTYTLDLKEVLDLILGQLAELVPYDRAALLLKRDNELQMIAARGFPPDAAPLEIRVTISEDDVFEKIHRTRQPLLITDVQGRPDWQNINSLPPARAWLGIPLIRFDQVIGMLSVTRETPAPYNEEDVTLAMAFSGQAAIALENARLYDDITRFSMAMEEKVRERTRELQLAYDQLERIDKTKSDFITITAHELRTPLTVLRGYSQMLLRNSAIQQNENHYDLVAGIHSGTTRLSEIVNNLLDMTKIDSRSLELYPEPLSVQALLEDVCQKLAENLAERDMTLQIEPMTHLPALEADPDALSKVFYHLIVNAIKYTPDGGRITFRGAALQEQDKRLDGPGLQLTISDTGIGINPTSHHLIFTKFYQTGELALHSSGKTKFKGGGPGLGLAITKGIVEAHQGKVWVESPGHNEETCPGSDFHILLPLKQGTEADRQSPPFDTAEPVKEQL